MFLCTILTEILVCTISGIFNKVLYCFSVSYIVESSYRILITFVQFGVLCTTCTMSNSCIYILIVDTKVPNKLQSSFIACLTLSESGFCGLKVACWPLVSKFTSSHPAEAVGFLGQKILQHAFFRRGSKAVGPMS
jgi:hypothetical protein